MNNSSFANCENIETQLGCIIMVMGGSNRTSQLAHSSYKCRFAVRSVFGGETYAFTDCFDAGYLLKLDLESILKFKISTVMLSYSEIFFKIIVKSATATERILVIDVKALREAFQNNTVDNIG